MVIIIIIQVLHVIYKIYYYYYYYYYYLIFLGIVLAVDDINELVQVECYVPSDGALVRFWYPVVYLEKPPKGYRKPSALRGAESVNILVHR